MPEVPRHRGPHIRRAGTGLLALLALAAVVQSWNHFGAGAVPRSNVARRVADLADVDDPASGTRLALAKANIESHELTDVRVAEADAVPVSRPSPPAEQTSSEEVSVDIEPTPELSVAQAEPEMATSPVDPGEADIGSAVEDPEPQGEGPSGTLAGTSGEGGEGPLSGIGGELGPLIGIIGGIALGGGSGPGQFIGPGTFIVGGGGSGCEGPGVQFPGPIAAGPQNGEFEGPGPLGGNPTAGAPTIRIPTTVPADPSGIIGSGGRGFVPEAPDLGRTNDSNFGSGTSLVTGTSSRNAPATGAAIARVIEEAARSFGTRSTRSTFSRPEARRLQGSSANAGTPAPATMRERVQRALVRPTESRTARPQATRQLQPSVRTTPTRSTSRAAQVRPSVRARQALQGSRPSVQARPTRSASPAARTRSNPAASAARRATQTRASASARPTRSMPSRKSQQ
jgi:hypothetical protein